MKRSVIFRVVTVAIGILVAVVIAITLWLKTPQQTSETTSFSLPHPTLAVSPFLKLFTEK